VSRNLQKYARQTNLQLIGGALIILFIVGDGLIYLFYGSNAALMGLLCLLIGLSPVVLIILAILILDWITRHVNRS
jgi:hypothetical protein